MIASMEMQYRLLQQKMKTLLANAIEFTRITL